MITIAPISARKAQDSKGLPQGFHIEIDSIAPDKSISHRCAMFSLLSDRPSIVHNYLLAQDTLHTLEIAKTLGLEVEELGQAGSFRFTPPESLREPDCVLDCGNAGTAMRLFAGLLAGQSDKYFVLSGDEYLCARPMKRVIAPLQDIGARIYARSGGYAPLSIIGSALGGFDYTSPIASAQVKSAMILAALHAKAPSVYRESELTRDHTERMLQGMGAPIWRESSGAIHISPLERKLEPLHMSVPGDPSSAFFFAVAAAIVPNSSVLLKNILLNPTRIEAFKVLESMGAIIEYRQSSSVYEEIGDIYVKSAPLHAVEVSENIAWLIDEIPALAIAFCFATGTSKVSGAKELRVKESDRIHAVVSNLRALGVECKESEDGFSVVGLGDKGAEANGGENGGASELDSGSGVLKSFGDHRIAMSFAILGLRTGARIDDEQCMAISFPNFVQILQKITEIRIS